jgi:WhiB family redox-sensing transcriptional regulator
VTDNFLDALTGNDRRWMERAACTDLPTDQFFVSEGESPAEAIAVCEQCSVSSDCLAYALKHRITDGVWGGTTAQERKRILRSRPKQPAA